MYNNSITITVYVCIRTRILIYIHTILMLPQAGNSDLC